jgi:hypothetical protein
MTFLVWNLNEEALRETCIDAAYYQCGWDFDGTSDDLLDILQLDITEFNPCSYDDLLEEIDNAPSCVQLAKFANSRLLQIYGGVLPAGINSKPISTREVVEHMYDLESIF